MTDKDSYRAQAEALVSKSWIEHKADLGRTDLRDQMVRHIESALRTCAEQAAAREREACANLIESFRHAPSGWQPAVLCQLAAAIRAQGGKE